jgi:hypothetical protein
VRMKLFEDRPRLPEKWFPLEERPPPDPRAKALPPSVDTKSAQPQVTASVLVMLRFIFIVSRWHEVVFEWRSRDRLLSPSEERRGLLHKESGFSCRGAALVRKIALSRIATTGCGQAPHPP